MELIGTTILNMMTDECVSGDVQMIVLVSGDNMYVCVERINSNYMTLTDVFIEIRHCSFSCFG